MLEVSNIHTYYGRSHILQGVTLQVKKGEMVCLLGRNGMGKSTTLKSIMGLTPPTRGDLVFEGQNLRALKAYQIPRLGISYVPEDRRIFASLSVGENLLLGTKIFKGMKRAQIDENLKRVYKYFPILQDKEKDPGRSLSGGQQQMLAIARGFMGNPKLMLMDEPSEGLAPIIVKELISIVSQMCREEGLTLILVEQNARLAIQASDRGYVLEKGVVRYEGDRSYLLESPDVLHCCCL
ncbi:MAG: ABC transporter ATP-binding protein [Pseudomonadota bacterium]